MEDESADKEDHANEHNSEEEGEIVDEAGERKTPSTDAHQSSASNDEPTPVYYDKAKSFFDTISCEAVERSKGKVTKPDWKAEKKLNRETFGVAGNVGRRNYFPSDRGNMRGRGGFSGGYNNYRGGYGQGGGYYRGGYGGQGGKLIVKYLARYDVDNFCKSIDVFHISLKVMVITMVASAVEDEA